MTPAATKKLIERTLVSKGILTTGDIFFVDSTSASKSDTAGAGRDATAPFATIVYAITQCTAAHGDVIVCMPGHIETCTGTADPDVSKSGIYLLGIGKGHLRAKIALTTAIGASFDISGASCTLDGFWIDSGFDAITAMVNVTAADVTIRNCEFMVADATYQSVLGVLASDAADRLLIEDCVFTGTSDAGTTSAISCGACDNTIIRNNVISGAFATGGPIANTAAAINFHVIGNFIQNRTADGNNTAVVFHASTVGLIANNRIAVIDSTSPSPITCAAGFVSGNYFTGAVSNSASTLK